MTSKASDTLHDVLAIAAHPDDIDITSGGTLICLADQGKKTAILDLTAGERGTLGDPQTRLREAAAAANILGVATRHCAGLPDTQLANTVEQKMIVAQHIRELRPDTVILPHWEQRHPDHRAACDIGRDACFFAGLKNVDLTGEPFRPNRIVYASYYRNHDYSFVIDITAVFERKLKAIACFASQFEKETSLAASLDALKGIQAGFQPNANTIFQPGMSVYELTLLNARQVGLTANVPLGEAYTAPGGILLADFGSVAVTR